MTTILALSSGSPPAAIAVIRTSGPSAHDAARRLCGALPNAREVALRKVHHPSSGEPLDTALIVRFDGPDTATGEDVVEYHCHGGRAVVAAVIEALTSIAGLRLAHPGEFTRRALANGRIDLTQAEGLADLLRAETESQRRAALSVAGGALSRQVELWQAQVLAMSAEAEAAIDYVDDENETATDHVALQRRAGALAAELNDWLVRPRVEPLRDGVRIAVAGPPNAGKSSLINAITGQDRSIVTEIAGTTRDTIEVPCSINGVPMVFVDTAGLRATTDPIEAYGISRGTTAMYQADIVVWLGSFRNAPDVPRLLIVQSKCDTDKPRRGAQVAVSAKTGENLSALREKLLVLAADVLPDPDQLVLNLRQADALNDAAVELATAPSDLLLLAEVLRSARNSFDRLTGRAGVDEALDALFSTFCLGK